MPAPLDTENIIDEANRVLAKKYKIQPGDPVIANLVLNQVILGRYVDEINQTLETQHKRMLKALETEEESARQIASKVITQSADYVDEVVQGWSRSFEPDSAESNASEAHKWVLCVGGFAIGLLIGVIV